MARCATHYGTNMVICMRNTLQEKQEDKSHPTAETDAFEVSHL